MSHAAAVPVDRGTLTTPPKVETAPVTPGKLAMWLFLATEIMFFTGLIGTYVVLRAGSPATAYSDKFSPGTVPSDWADQGAKIYNWPLPYDSATNPLSIDLTAANTFILICSSVSMVLALAAIQRGDRKKLTMWLGVTVIFGSIFLGVQVYEYYQLLFGHHYPIGISRSGHFTPDVSLFASCFFTMTGFHGAHVAGGVVMLICLFLSSLFGVYTKERHGAVELVGLYWHFVDLVWIILFTVVYLI
ncbi:MAG: heme-copper oxidase subunit III [Isosphaeraceae bacterium]|nr:heme-copper oxidase subunit III [Isosphaeraceae bacterium]